MNDMNARVLKIIRSSGGYNDKRLVMVCGLGDDSEQTLKSFEVPDDEYIILTVHYYYPWTFLQNWWAVTTWGTEEDKKYPDSIFKQLYDKFVKNGLPIVVGEYGVSAKTDRLSRFYYYDYLVKTTYKYGITCIWWDNGGSYHRTKRYWIDGVSKDIIVNAGLGIPNSFVFPLDNYFKQQWDTQRGIPFDIPIQDLTVKLELNSNELVNIYNGKTRLFRGWHYVIDSKNSTVTIKKRYLAKLLKSKNLGIVATLKFDFSNGTDLPLYIIKYDLPKFAEVPITVNKINGDVQSDIEIPVSFNGTKLATVSVIDRAEKKPIIDSWTPYLKMYGHFDYTDTEIILKKDLLNSLKTDSLLTFEFWPRNVKIEMKILVKPSYLLFVVK
jgi:endoglucanase